MIGRLYRIGIGNQAQTAAKTLLEVTAPSDAVLTVERWHIGQTSADASENLGTKAQRITTTGTGTTSTSDVVPLESGNAAFGGVVKTNLTSEPTYTANTVLFEMGFNVLSGALWTPANDDEIIVISPSALVGFNLDVDPDASMNFSYNATIREIGG